MTKQKMLDKAAFKRLLQQYSGRIVQHIPVTKLTSNLNGEETLSDGTSEYIKVHFVKTKNSYDFDKAGFIEKGDAVMLSDIDDDVNKDDKIIVNGETFRVKEALDVAGVFDYNNMAGTEYVYTACNLFLLS